MANSLYDKGRERFLTAALHWGTDTIKAALLDTGAYSVSTASHEYLSDVAAAAFIAPTNGSKAGITLTTKGTAGGAADAADVTFTAVSGTSIEAILLFKDTGAEGTSPLIAYIDTATGLPITPNGGDIIVTWDNGPNKIFKL